MILKNFIRLTALVTLLIALSAPPALLAAEVVQGKCKTVNEQDKTLIMEVYSTSVDSQNPYGKPTGEEITINFSQSLIGLDPQEGNVLRVAYVNKANVNAAIRIMNISRQGLLNK